MRKLFKNYPFPLILFGITLFIVFRNYQPGTWLLGWDNLLPELNFKLNIARSFSTVWQEYQGLGLVGGMAHAADLPRQLILWVFSLILPTSFLRYFWAFLMLYLGPLGIYLMLSRAILNKDSSFVGKLAGFASAIFYLFNLATLQIFYTPFETFVSFYGFFPWLLYFALDYLKNGGKEKLLVYVLISLLATGAFHVQTLFVVYAVFLSVFALETIVRCGKEGLLRSIKLALVTFFVNAFWLLPALYFTLTSAFIPVSSHINSIATPETQLMNEARTGLTNIATLKGYWFDYYDWGQNGTYDYLYKTWIGYSNQPAVEKVSLALFIISAFGLVISLLKKKTSYGFSFVVLLGISYFMLNGGSVPGFPFFSEIFRNAFTKWSNAAALVYAIGLGLFICVISDIISNKLKYFLASILSLLIVSGSVFTLFPILNGNLTANSMRVRLPSYYLDTVNYFKTQDPTKRIVDFPLTDFWGWKFSDWGYRGSGFLWYGIPQPMLDRAFDVWSPNNEAFYNEISHAVEAGSQDELKYVFNKYQVSYILFDDSVFEPGNLNSAANIQREKDFLESSLFITKVKEFGKITLYQINLEGVNSFVSAPQSDLSSPFIMAGQTGGVVIKEKFPSTQGYQNAKNCDAKGRGSVTKSKTDGGNYYEAVNDGVSCDYFYYSTLDYSQAYQMRLIGKNISGRSLIFYLYNVKNKNVDMQELLPSGNFDKSYLILPTESPSISLGMGYTLSVETRSFGKEKSENLITGIEFYPVAYQKVNGPVPIANNLVIGNVKKFGTWAYKVDVQGSGMIQLGQGFEKGWVAFTVNSERWTVNRLEHIKFDSWSNAFTVHQPPFTNHQIIYIIFWPQLLEWGGGLLGLVTLLCIL
jgi:hypothetical protein